MITFMVVCDNAAETEKTAGSIIGGTELSTCALCMRTAEEALQTAEEAKHQIDLFIISIKMKEQSGYRLAEKIRKIKGYEKTPILFLTNLSYNLTGFERLSTYESYKTTNYISLPVSRIDVQGKFGLYLDSILHSQKEANTRDFLHLTHNKGEVLLLADDILFAEVQDKTCVLHTKTQSYTSDRRTLEQMIREIGDSLFLRCHKSFAVNAKQIKEIERCGKRNWKAVFSEKTECPISLTYISSVREACKRAFQVK